MEVTEKNYYDLETNREYCSASQYLSFIGRPLLPGCEARTMAELRGEYKQETTKAMLIGSILDALWEGASADELVERFPDCVSTRGATKGELKAEYKQAITLYERTHRDPIFLKAMSGIHQPIFTCEIEGLPFKCKLDSFHEGKMIVDLKTTENTDIDHRYFIKDSGERVTFFDGWRYDIQLALYREAVRQATGDLCDCYIAAVDKKPHPKPIVIKFEDEVLDKALDEIKRNCSKIIRLKSGIDEPIKCNMDGCDYCRDTYVARIMTTSEFKEHDISGSDI